MLDYAALYEYLRKEKYSEQLQVLPKSFISDFSEYLQDKRKSFSDSQDFFSEDLLKDKKQVENALSIFKELMLRRKKKILSLVFVASETGILKKDSTTLLPFEHDLFENLVRVVDAGDKELANSLNGRGEVHLPELSLVIAKDKIEEFVDLTGGIIGPFEKGQLISLPREVASILVSDGRASLVDED